jgi:hypothetical protein
LESLGFPTTGSEVGGSDEGPGVGDVIGCVDLAAVELLELDTGTRVLGILVITILGDTDGISDTVVSFVVETLPMLVGILVVEIVLGTLVGDTRGMLVGELVLDVPFEAEELPLVRIGTLVRPGALVLFAGRRLGVDVFLMGACAEFVVEVLPELWTGTDVLEPTIGLTDGCFTLGAMEGDLDVVVVFDVALLGVVIGTLLGDRRGRRVGDEVLTVPFDAVELLGARKGTLVLRLGISE